MKKLILGIIIGLTLGLSTNALAAVGDSVTAVFTQFNYVVNGEAKTLDAPVLVHDGNSYLRTTQISNMLGYDVTYKADTRTIEFDNPQPSATPTPGPSGEPTPSPEESPGASPTPEPTPTPAPTNVAACQAIRDNYGYQISQLPYHEISQGKIAQKTLLLEYARDQELAAAGCQ